MAYQFTDAQLKELGYLAWRQLEDGVWIGISPMTFGKGRLYYDVDWFGAREAYCYSSIAEAVASMNAFEPARDEEPQGWFRHVQSGRRRPDGDPAQEYIMP